jgi:WD40 repeat protein
MTTGAGGSCAYTVCNLSVVNSLFWVPVVFVLPHPVTCHRLLVAPRYRYLRYFKGHRDAVVSLEMSPSSDMFLSASKDKTVRMWDLRAHPCQVRLGAVLISLEIGFCCARVGQAILPYPYLLRVGLVACTVGAVDSGF